MNILDILIQEQLEGERRSGLRASDLGLCPGYVYYSMRYPERVESIKSEMMSKLTQEEKLARTMSLMIGKAVHNEVERILSKNGVVVASEIECYNEQLDITGHFDLLLDLRNDDYLDLIDIKTMNSWGLKYMKEKELKAKDYHEQQVMIYKYALKKVYKKKIRPSILYIGKDSGDMAQFYVQNEAKSLKQAKEFFENINSALMFKTDPKVEDVVFNESKKEYEINWKSKFCPVHHLCAGDDWEIKANKKVKELNEKLKSKK